MSTPQVHTFFCPICDTFVIGQRKLSEDGCLYTFRCLTGCDSRWTEDVEGRVRAPDADSPRDTNP